MQQSGSVQNDYRLPLAGSNPRLASSVLPRADLNRAENKDNSLRWLVALFANEYVNPSPTGNGTGRSRFLGCRLFVVALLCDYLICGLVMA